MGDGDQLEGSRAGEKGRGGKTNEDGLNGFERRERLNDRGDTF
jgi:hypothetical protein